MYPLPVAARFAGLSPATLRMWTRRYDNLGGVVDDSGRRTFAESDLSRLRTLRLLTDRGLRIGDLVGLSDDDLARLLSEAPPQKDQTEPAPSDASEVARPSFSPPAAAAGSGYDADMALQGAMAAVENYNPWALRSVVDSALVSLGRLRFADEFLFPLVKEAQSRLVDGRLRPIHQTFLVSHLTTELAAMLATCPEQPTGTGPAAPSGTPGPHDGAAADRGPGPSPAPPVIVASPGGAGAELGCLASAVHIAAAGLSPIYVGTGVPGEDLVDAVRRSGAVGLVLSVVRPGYDQRLTAEMVALRRRLPADTPLFVGGRLSQDTRDALTSAGVEVVPDMTALSQTLYLLKERAG